MTKAAWSRAQSRTDLGRHRSGPRRVADNAAHRDGQLHLVAPTAARTAVEGLHARKMHTSSGEWGRSEETAVGTPASRPIHSMCTRASGHREKNVTASPPRWY